MSIFSTNVYKNVHILDTTRETSTYEIFQKLQPICLEEDGLICSFCFL